MVLRAILHNWLQNAAKAKVRDAVVQAAREQLAQPRPPPAEEPEPCHLGVVFALGIESGCFEDLLQGAVTIRGHGFRLREGGLHGRRVVLILSGPGRKNARRATEILIDGHRPGLVVSAGFAGGLSPQLDATTSSSPIGSWICPASVDRRAGRFVRGGGPAGRASRSAADGRPRGPLAGGEAVAAATPRCAGGGHGDVRRGRGLPAAADSVCVGPRDQRRGGRDVAPRRGTPVASEDRPARLGAALGAVRRRPASLKAMYQLHGARCLRPAGPILPNVSRRKKGERR